METLTSKKKKFELKPGKSYKLRIPIFSSIVKVHIDYILDSKVYENYPLVVYRVWIKQKKYWQQYIRSLEEIEIYNK